MANTSFEWFVFACEVATNFTGTPKEALALSLLAQAEEKTVPKNHIDIAVALLRRHIQATNWDWLDHATTLAKRPVTEETLKWYPALRRYHWVYTKFVGGEHMRPSTFISGNDWLKLRYVIRSMGYQYPSPSVEGGSGNYISNIRNQYIADFSQSDMDMIVEFAIEKSFEEIQGLLDALTMKEAEDYVLRKG
jgi:hypothetical protein